MKYDTTINLTLHEKVAILKDFPLFEGIDTKHIQEFAEKMSPKVLQPMEVFVEEDIDEHQAFFVYKGAVSIFRTTKEGEIINIDLQGAPEIVGKMGLIDTQKSTASAMAIGEINALVLNQDDFQTLILEHPQVALRLLRIFADRIHHFDRFLEQLLSQSLHDRTLFLLQKLATYFPNKEITLSQEELADLLWGTRSRVTEVLQQLEDDGKIQVSHRKVKVL
jgi:CRP-like cAMP-binding protein